MLYCILVNCVVNLNFVYHLGMQMTKTFLFKKTRFFFFFYYQVGVLSRMYPSSRSTPAGIVILTDKWYRNRMDGWMDKNILLLGT